MVGSNETKALKSVNAQIGVGEVSVLVMNSLNVGVGGEQ